MSGVVDVWAARTPKLLELLVEHLGLTLVSLAAAAAVALPLAVWARGRPRAAGALLAGASALQTVPSIALLGALIPLLGIGYVPALVALFAYALLPILQNGLAGLRGVDAAVRDAARGVGMSERQVLRRVELPLAAPVLLAGLRTAAVINVGVATLAAYVGAGGLGEWIFEGIALDRPALILAGALPAAALALAFDGALAYLARRGASLRTAGATTGALVLAAAAAGLALSLDDRPRAGFDPEFAERPDGYPRLRRTYPELALNTSVLNAGLMYGALTAGEVDVVAGYSTDGRIRAYGLAVLDDDRGAFLPYRAGVLARADALARVPGLAATLGLLEGRLADSTMRRLNHAVDAGGARPAAVARDWLAAEGMLGDGGGAAGAQRATLRVGGKPFTEQYVLAEVLAQLIESRLPVAVERVGGLGGTDVAYGALAAGELDAYVEYSGTALQVILKASDRAVDSLVAADGVRDYLGAAFAKTGLAWAVELGFENTYALVVREAPGGAATVSALAR